MFPRARATLHIGSWQPFERACPRKHFPRLQFFINHEIHEIHESRQKRQECLSVCSVYSVVLQLPRTAGDSRTEGPSPRLIFINHEIHEIRESGKEADE